MAEKQRYTVTIPYHVSSQMETHAKTVGATPTEYAADIIRWWFGQGCPPVTPDEIELRKRTKLDVWNLNPNDRFVITDDVIVTDLLKQLGIPNLFVQAAEHDVVRLSVAFDNHPTHWLLISLFKGSDTKAGDGLAFLAEPKAQVTRQQMLEILHRTAEEMEATEDFQFSQLPSVPTMHIGKAAPR